MYQIENNLTCTISGGKLTEAEIEFMDTRAKAGAISGIALGAISSSIMGFSATEILSCTGLGFMGGFLLGCYSGSIEVVLGTYPNRVI